MTPDEALAQRAWAYEVRAQHDPAVQENGYDRCALCHYTRHPCDTYELADTVIALTATPPNVDYLLGQLAVASAWVRRQHPFNTEGLASIIDDAAALLRRLGARQDAPPR